MRITLFSAGLGPGGGTAGVAFTLSAGLVARGHHVRVVCRSATACPDGVEVVADEGAPQPGDLRVGLDRIAGCDVVRASGGVHEMWSRVSATSLSRWMRTTLPRERREARREARALREARLVVCNAMRAAGEVQAWHGVPSERVRIVRNGVDLARFRPDRDLRMAARRAWGAEGRVALFVGHGWWRKGLANAVEAFARVASARDRLVVMGRDARSQSRLRAARARLGDRLIAPGPGDPAHWMPGADVLLHPTRYDASANAVLEAMACGVPPVTTSRDGAAEIVPARELVVGNPDDVQGIANALRYAWSASGMPDRWRGVAEAWPASRMVGAFESILQELRDGG